MQRKIRVLVGKPGLDGHDRGAKVVAAALRDAGMEVIYTGLHQSPEQIVEAALQEDVDVVALSVLSGAHMTFFPEVLERMKRLGLGDRLLTGGGIIPSDDMEALSKLGVGRLFGPGASTQDIAAYIRDWFIGRYGETALESARPASAMSLGSMPEAPDAAAGGVPVPLPTTGRLAVRRASDRAERLARLKAEAAHHLPSRRAKVGGVPARSGGTKTAPKRATATAKQGKTSRPGQSRKKGQAPKRKPAVRKSAARRPAAKRRGRARPR